MRRRGKSRVSELSILLNKMAKITECEAEIAYCVM